ncbi:DUF1566 domain-containing protein [Reinekea marinisedimentorum]|uniref:Uncharacterized protein DUF1566 n=1 Tax=Reinekea marinisedimentorum TaxID=230495 RepID=A0A4R3IET6_9GAMM|nr:DUF1566 domain-containing protein [Reinekea marinisedimentorum]TCS43311.1 uncharacterized protein DUF1566 [Reinekea marinisedimentorum]
MFRNKSVTSASIVMLGFLAVSGCGSDEDDSTEGIDSVTEAASVVTAEASTFTVVDTGLDQCYDGDGQVDDTTGVAYITCPAVGEAFFGQDAQYGEDAELGGSGVAFNFEFETDDGGEIKTITSSYEVSIMFSDTTVTTEEFTWGAVVVDNNTGLMWQAVPDNGRYSYEEAQDYIDGLNDETYQGYSDWRMPTMKELYSIADFSVGWPYLDMDYFVLPTYAESSCFSHDCVADIIDFDAKDEQYWSQFYVGNTYEAGSDGAFGLNHGTGHIKVYPAAISGTMAKAVRAVRGTEDSYGVNSFTLNESDYGNTVTDSATGLMWTQDDSAATDLLAELNRLITEGVVVITDGEDTTEGDVGVIGLLNWQDALAFAENADFGGYDDWRLPNIKELQTIFDYEHAPTAGFYSEDADTSSTESTDGSPSESGDALTWYDGCADELAEGHVAASEAECAARGPAIDTDYFIATSINDVLAAGLAAEVMSADGELYSLYNIVTVQQGLSDYGYYWSSTSTRYGTNDADLNDNTEDNDGYRDTDYAFAWYAAVGSAVNDNGEDYHGAGAIRYDVKDEDSGAVGEDAERIFNFVRLVRDAD